MNGEIKKYKNLIRLLTPLLYPLFIFLFISIPFHKKISRLEKEHLKYNNLFKELGIASSFPSQDSNLIQRIEELGKIFYTSESESIESISQICYKLGIDLISISPVKKEKMVDKDKKPLYFGKKIIYLAVFKLSLNSNFLNLMEFLEEIEKNKKIIVLNNLNIEKKNPLDSASDSLKIDLELQVFILG